MRRLVVLTRRTFDLLFAGIDLKQTPSGEFYCFEVNPSPGFLYYERHTGQPISTKHRQPNASAGRAAE